MEEILKKREKVFAWDYEDMPGIDKDIVKHNIPIYPHVSPIKRNQRRLRPEWALLSKNRWRNS